MFCVIRKPHASHTEYREGTNVDKSTCRIINWQLLQLPAVFPASVIVSCWRTQNKSLAPGDVTNVITMPLFGWQSLVSVRYHIPQSLESFTSYKTLDKHEVWPTIIASEAQSVTIMCAEDVSLWRASMMHWAFKRWQGKSLELHEYFTNPTVVNVGDIESRPETEDLVRRQSWLLAWALIKNKKNMYS